MEGEEKMSIREGLVTFIESKRKDAYDNVDRTGLSILAWGAGYGDVQREDLLLLLDFVPAKKEDIRELISEKWKPDESLSQERKKAWQGKTYPEVVAYLKECKVKRLQQLVGREVRKDEIYATLRSDALSPDKAREIILQDLADLHMFETQIQKRSYFGRLSGLWNGNKN
jgi:hypothetical protein